MSQSYRGKPHIQVWAYSSDGTSKHYESITQAALNQEERLVTVRQAANDCRITRKGTLYSFKPLTTREVDEKFKELEEKQAKLKKNQPKQQRANSNCKEIIGKQEFEVDCFDRQVTYIPRNRHNRVMLLKKLIWTKLENKWMQMPQKVVVLEKRAFQELLNSLE